VCGIDVLGEDTLCGRSFQRPETRELEKRATHPDVFLFLDPSGTCDKQALAPDSIGAASSSRPASSPPPPSTFCRSSVSESWNNLLADKRTTSPAYAYDGMGLFFGAITLYVSLTSSKLDVVCTIVTRWTWRCLKTKYKARTINVASVGDCNIRGIHQRATLISQVF